MALQIPPNCDLSLGLVCVDKSVPGTSVWTMMVDDRYLNPAGVLQGGIVAAMMDSSMGASAVTGVVDRKVFVANTEMTVSFLTPVRLGSELTCTARVLKASKLVAFLEARIVDQDNQLVATASSTYILKDRTE